MQKMETYESFPLWIPLLANLFAISIYAIGGYILWLSVHGIGASSGLAAAAVVLYLGYCAWVEFRVLRISCVDCYYYGKTCGLGKGRLCSLFFERGEPQRFVETEVSWASVLPDFMVTIFPLAIGIVRLAVGFSWVVLGLLAVLALLSFGGNAMIRGSLACKYCRQREIGCPAERLFGRGKERTLDE